MSKFFITIAILFISSILIAQQSFDILSYQAPNGWNQQSESSKLTLKKTLFAKIPCSITMYSSEAASHDGKRDFNTQWNKYVKNVYSNVKDSITIETERSGEWMVYSTTSTCSVNKREVNYIFTTLVSGNKIISVMAVATDEACLNEINNFYASLEVQGTTEKRKAISKKRIKFRLGKNLKDDAVPKTK